MNKQLTEVVKSTYAGLITLFMACVLCTHNGACQQLGVGFTFANYAHTSDYEVEPTGPGYSLSFDKIDFASEKKSFTGGELVYIPTIDVEEKTHVTSGMKIMKLVGSVYTGRLVKLSDRFFLSGSVGGNLGYGQIKSWNDDGSGWTKVPQLLIGLRTAEQLHIRVKHSAIIIGFEQWFMINSSTISSFKVGYSFSLGKK